MNVDKYERSGDRKGYRSGHYERNFSTTSGDVTLKVPKLTGIQFETAIIERYNRRECSVEEALIEMYLAGVFVRRVEDITEALWGSKVSQEPSATSTRKRMSTSRNGVPVLLLRSTLTSTLMVFTLNVAGVVKTRMSLSSWPLV